MHRSRFRLLLPPVLRPQRVVRGEVPGCPGPVRVDEPRHEVVSPVLYRINWFLTFKFACLSLAKPAFIVYLLKMALLLYFVDSRQVLEWDIKITSGLIVLSFRPL